MSTLHTHDAKETINRLIGMVNLEVREQLRLPLLLITPLLALAITFLYAIRSKDAFVSILMGMVGGGALGNREH